MPAAVVKQISQAADVWLWGITPETVKSYQPLLSTQSGRTLTLAFDSLRRSSFLSENRSWLSGLQNSDFYFCEVQQTDAAEYTMKGSFVDEGEVLLNACKTDWRSWNLRPEELKNSCLATLRKRVYCHFACLR